MLRRNRRVLDNAAVPNFAHIVASSLETTSHAVKCVAGCAIKSARIGGTDSLMACWRANCCHSSGDRRPEA
jgi:hypothetical protein